MNNLPTDNSNAAGLEKAPDFQNPKDRLEVIDMGDAARETKQVAPYPLWADSLLGVGLQRDW